MVMLLLPCMLCYMESACKVFDKMIIFGLSYGVQWLYDMPTKGILKTLWDSFLYEMCKCVQPNHFTFDGREQSVW